MKGRSGMAPHMPEVNADGAQWRFWKVNSLFKWHLFRFMKASAGIAIAAFVHYLHLKLRCSDTDFD